MKTKVRITREELNQLFNTGIRMRIGECFPDNYKNRVILLNGNMAIFQFEQDIELEAEVVEECEYEWGRRRDGK